MWGRQLILGIIGLSSGLLVAGGLYGFIVSLGVISDLADRTKTASKILLYENAIILGGVLGNIVDVYRIYIRGTETLMAIFGLFAGIFVGCWSMALAEVLNVFPIFVRRGKLVKYLPCLILSLALGKCVGALIYFVGGW